jgi:subtilisin family serine protease
VAANAIAAYDSGATGKGVKIGIIDSGINPALSEFAGRIDPASGTSTDSAALATKTVTEQQ